MPWTGQIKLIILNDAYNRLFLSTSTPGQYYIDYGYKMPENIIDHTETFIYFHNNKAVLHVI